jgi:uncharacterized short protein YbdD (DUF466 family)
MPRERGALRRAVEFLRRVAGMPDYERYVARLRAERPAGAVPSRRAYFERFVRDRYDRPGGRCC